MHPVRIARPAVDEVAPDAVALRDDLMLATDLLRSGADPATLDYLSSFLVGLAKCTGDAFIGELAADIAAHRAGPSAGFLPLEIATALENHAGKLNIV